MNEPENQNNQPDPADALAALVGAVQKTTDQPDQPDKIDNLEKQPARPESPPEPPQEPKPLTPEDIQATESIQALLAADQSPQTTDALESMAGSLDSQAADVLAAHATDLSGANTRMARSAALQEKATKAHAHHIKSMMIPMLLAAAVLLVALGVATGFMLPTEEERLYHTDPSSLLGQWWAKYLVWAAFPLAIILAIAAGLFWLDVRQDRDSRVIK